MDDRTLLNTLYKELHELGVGLLKAVRALGYDARLCYHNLHEVRVDGVFQTEYFPLPEIEIFNVADLGISLDKSLWLELTITREAALQLDYPSLAQAARLEVYGADDYLGDFCNAEMGFTLTRERIAASNEQAVHLCFYPPDNDPAALTALLKTLTEARILAPPKHTSAPAL
jgi:hypothetical protein